MKNSDPGHPVVSPGHIVGGGHYSLHVPLGESGLLWLAQDEEQQRLATIRFLRSEIRQDPAALATLKARVEAAKQVQHENLCRVLEWYESPGLDTFIASEYIEGKPLTMAMDGGPGKPVPWDWLKPAVASLASAIEAMHRARVVHHGISPENVMVSADKRVKLLNAVVTGVLKNPLYVPSALSAPHELRTFSPQQIAGNDPSTADDYYALGATLFELLTGTPVFGNGATLLHDVQAVPATPLRDRLREKSVTYPVPDNVVRFIDACLSKEPSARPTSLQQFLPAPAPAAAPAAPAPGKLQETLPQRAAPSVPVKKAPVVAEELPADEVELVRKTRQARPRSAIPLALAACAVGLAAVGAGTWFVLHRQSEDKSRIASVAADEARKREMAEKEKQEIERRLEQERIARLKSEAEARIARETAERAAAEARSRAEEEALARMQPGGDKNAASSQAAPPSSRPGPPPLPIPTSTEGYFSMFNGRDLSEWSGDPNIWSVKDGCITAIAKGNEPKERYYLTWQKGSVADFEIHFSWRFRIMRGNKSPNGGVNYRMRKDGEFATYQFDLQTDAREVGAVNDDKRRYRLAGLGESGVAPSGGSTRLDFLQQLGDPKRVEDLVHEDWNRGVIIARGNRLTHYINNHLVADVTDESRSRRLSSGLIALELYTRNTNNCATFLQFKDLKIKLFDSNSSGDAKLASAQR
jgi:hypothetical protein